MKKVLLTLLSVFTVLLFISCGSKPQAEQTTPEAPVEEELETVVTDESDDEAAMKAAMEEIEAARSLAIEAGAEAKAPELLMQVDAFYESLKGPDLKDNANNIITKYKMLANYLKAKDAKQEVDDNGFAFYAQKNYDEGVHYLSKVESAYANPKEMDSQITYFAENAYSSFNTVLIVAYKRLARDERELTYEAKRKADSVKAGMAQKARYKTAADEFQSGDSLYAMQSPKKALDKYVSAKEQFLSLYEDVKVQRAAAEAAIEAAKKRVAESKKYAEEADAKSPITEQVDGIEDEEAVLLEEDDYGEPEDAIADIAESIDDSYDPESLDEDEDDESLDEDDAEETEEEDE